MSAALISDAFWAVRAEVAKALAKIQLAQAVDGLLKGLDDKHPNVRRAVVNALSGVKTADSYKALKSVVEKGDESYYVEGAAATALGKEGYRTKDKGKDKEKKTQKLWFECIQIIGGCLGFAAALYRDWGAPGTAANGNSVIGSDCGGAE